jgi:ketol-acid reductoisomerase
MQILRDADADVALIRSRTVAIVGFGNQGRAHAENLRDSGVEVVLGFREESTTLEEAIALGFETMPIREAVRRAQVVLLSTPDEAQAAVYEASIAPELTSGHALAFPHGFSVHFRQIVPPESIDVILVAPVGPGKQLRSRFVAGGGIPCLVAVHQDASGHARALALSYAAAIGSGRAGILETTFRDECETDLFGEQTVVCGGVSHLILAGFETLVEAGYPEELAFFECAHQMKLLVDLIFERGIAGMRHAISSTAKYGDLTRGPRIIDDHTKAQMREVLAEVQSGAFAQEWIAEHAAGRPNLERLIEASERHPIEAAGARLRRL